MADPRPAGDARPPSPDHGAVGRPARNRPPTLAAPAGSPDHGQQRPGPGGAYGVRHAAGRALAALAAASLLVGAYLAVRFTVPTKLVGRIMGFGAGALVAALAYELIPDSYVADLQIWLGFGAGALLFYSLDSVLERRSADASGPGLAIALGVLLDGVPESIVLGVGIAVGGSVSVGFLVAVLVSNIPEGLSATADLRATRSPVWIYRLWGSIALVSGIAAALGYLVAHHLSTLDGRYVQALAAGAVLTMLSDSMMPEAFKEGGRPTALLTALGFAVAALLTTLD